MHIPVKFGLVGPDGRDMSWQSVAGAQVDGSVIHLRKRQHKVVFGGVRERPAVSLLREFSAPVTINFEQRPEDAIFLARHDNDPYARWQALNSLCMQALVAASRAIRGRKAPQFDTELLALCGEFAGQNDLEPAFRGLALSMPGETEIAREIGKNIDPDSIFMARAAFLSAIASKNSTIFETVFDDMEDHGPFSPDAESAGRRALGNAMLDYLSISDGKPDRAGNAYDSATNMTDRAAALALLAHRFPGDELSRKSLADFEARHGGDPVVMDKWFSVQATIPGAQTLETVRQLSGHKSYSIRNPNRFRALIGAFAAGNHTGFNRPDGQGYQYVAEQILAMEVLNPQVAARLATVFRSFRGLEPTRREKARQALVYIAERKSLSTDLRDIVDRLLA